MKSKIISFYAAIIVVLGSLGTMGMEVRSNMDKTTDYHNKTDEFWKQHLKPEVYHICRQKGTERAGSGQYDHFYEKGTYYCACCGGDHALYSSQAKYDSGTGWPSFWEPITPTSVVLKEDKDGLLGWAFPRTEVVCSRCGGHLGHVFNDGPKDHTGLRYCMNSVALIFVPEGQEPKHILEAASSETGSPS